MPQFSPRRARLAAWLRCLPTNPSARRQNLTLTPLEDRTAPAIFTVTNTLDGVVTSPNQLPGSLRQAVFDANALAGADSIVFGAPVFSTAKTITVSNGEFALNDALTITGPIVGVTINAAVASRIINMSGAPSATAISISNMTLMNGQVTGTNDGGGILATSQKVSLTDVTISNCVSQNRGGAIAFVGSGSITLNQCTLSGNQAATLGGGIALNGANGIFDYCTISGNKLTGTNGNGGGIGNVGALLIVRSSTISGNSAGPNGSGGGVSTNTLAALRNCTVAFNTALNGGGVTGNGNTLTSTILANNTATGVGPDTNSKILAVTSLISNMSGASLDVGSANNVLNANPLLAPLANNGGPTLTHAISVGSPAIDVGSNPNGFSSDQRGNGFSRVVGAGTDMGAFEVQVPAKVFEITINSTKFGVERTQRSRVVDVAVTFDRIVQFVGGNSNAAAAFTLNRVSYSPGAVSLAALVDNSGPGTVVTLSFTGGAVDNISLADGRYALHVLASKVATGLDGDSNGTAGDDFMFDEPPYPAALDANRIFRLFFDYNGDGIVAANDLVAFNGSLGATGFIFDFDNDGAVAASDFIQFRLRFGGSI